LYRELVVHFEQPVVVNVMVALVPSLVTVGLLASANVAFADITLILNAMILSFIG
jgi:uncharacterized membrane protein